MMSPMTTDRGTGTLRLLAVLAVGLSATTACASGNPATAYRAMPSVSSAAPTAGLAQPYQSPDGYSIRPPIGWVPRPGNGQDGRSAAYTAPAVDRANPKAFAMDLTIVVRPVTADLQTLVDQAKEQTPRTLVAYQVVTDKPVMANGLPGHLLGGTYDDRGDPRENLQLLVVNTGKVYTVTFTGPASRFASLHDLALASMSSFTVS